MKYFLFLRAVKRSLDKVKSFAFLPFIAKDFIAYKSIDHTKRFSTAIIDILPCVFDKTPFTRFDTHYVYHTAWAARKVKEIGQSKHIDISSSLYFSSIVSAFVPVDFYDYRPANLNLSNLNSRKGDLLSLPFKDKEVSSLSCMHTIEHVGLGRYGDPIDPEGDIKAVEELVRVTKEGGSILFVVPVGKPRIQFNAHRIYSYEMVMDMFKKCHLKEFSLIPDNALEEGMIMDADPKLVKYQKYGCGCFWFVKK